MSLAVLKSRALAGMHAPEVTVEVSAHANDPDQAELVVTVRVGPFDVALPSTGVTGGEESALAPLSSTRPSVRSTTT